MQKVYTLFKHLSLPFMSFFSKKLLIVSGLCALSAAPFAAAQAVWMGDPTSNLATGDLTLSIDAPISGTQMVFYVNANNASRCDVILDNRLLGVMTFPPTPQDSFSEPYIFPANAASVTHTAFARCYDGAGNHLDSRSVHSFVVLPAEQASSASVPAAAPAPGVGNVFLSNPPTVGQSFTFAVNTVSDTPLQHCQLLLDGVAAGDMALNANGSYTLSYVHQTDVSPVHAVQAQCWNSSGQSVVSPGINYYTVQPAQNVPSSPAPIALTAPTPSATNVRALTDRTLTLDHKTGQVVFTCFGVREDAGYPGLLQNVSVCDGQTEVAVHWNGQRVSTMLNTHLNERVPMTTHDQALVWDQPMVVKGTSKTTILIPAHTVGDFTGVSGNGYSAFVTFDPKTFTISSSDVPRSTNLLWNKAGTKAIYLEDTCGGAGCARQAVMGLDLASNRIARLTKIDAAYDASSSTIAPRDANDRPIYLWKSLRWITNTRFEARYVNTHSQTKILRQSF